MKYKVNTKNMAVVNAIQKEYAFTDIRTYYLMLLLECWGLALQKWWTDDCVIIR